MTINNDIFKNILSKYKFTNEIPREIRHYIYINKRKSLNSTLKKINEYSIFYAIIIYLYFFFHNSGVKVSLLFCKILLVAATVSITGSTSFITYRYLINQKQENITTETIQENKKQTTQNENIKSTPKISLPKVFLSFSKIESIEKHSSISNDITERIYESVRQSKNSKSIILDSGKNKKTVSEYKFTGRLHEVGNRFILTVKIINTGNSTIKYSRTFSLDKDKDVDIIVNDISKSITELDSLW